MDKKLLLKAKVYLKNGLIIDESVKFSDENEQEDINDIVRDLKSVVKEGFKEGINFSVTIGTTIFKGSEIAAIKFDLE